MQEKQQITSLPDNAYRELRDGEQYNPVMGADQTPVEVTPYSVSIGLLMAVLFSAAAAYLGLKVGQVFEAAIPIAIIAVGLGQMRGKKNMLGQNVIIQSIGASSGVVVAGAIFTLPALYILGLDAQFYQVFLSSLLGGVLGIILMIPFRKYFVKEMHGKYPFPEATATTEVLVSGEKGGSQAKILVAAGLIGGLYDFIVSTFGAWVSSLSTQMWGWGKALAANFKLTFGLNTSAAVLGLGYIIGLKYALIIAAGSALVWFFIVPLVGSFDGAMDAAAMVSMLGITNGDILANPELIFTPENLYTYIGRPIGIGGIAMAGLIGIIRQAGIIKSALVLAKNEFSSKRSSDNEPRTQLDIRMKTILTILIATLAATLFFFQFGVLGDWTQTIVALAIVFVIAFLFTTVAANAIAIVGSNPVSGMTLMTLILSSLVLVSVGLEGESGMIAALVIGGVVCTALSMAGGFITDLKVGYWLGTTPKKQQTWKFVGTFVSAATVAGVMIIMNDTYGFVGENALIAPQANAMAAVIQPLMMGGVTPWLLYGIGAGLILVLTLINVPALPFALGMFIPMSLNAPLVVGGLVSWAVNRHKNPEQAKANNNRGTLIASGFIAGGALMGVVSAILAFVGVDWVIAGWADSMGAVYLGILMYVAIMAYFIWHSRRAKIEE
ncbi:MAG: oligopeptide transporter, OPT family [Alistipes sp.]|nr:oligopeptide transporter, OPT family [Alistipes sp.]MBO5972711.1 oligopeptide transporter, OPT family [Alistipes sp.]